MAKEPNTPGSFVSYRYLGTLASAWNLHLIVDKLGQIASSTPTTTTPTTSTPISVPSESSSSSTIAHAHTSSHAKVLDTAVIAGVAATVFILVAILGFCIYRRRQGKSTSTSDVAQPDDAATCYFPVLLTPAVSMGTGTGLSTAQYQSSKRGSLIVEDGDDVLNMAPLRKFKLEVDDLVTVGSKPIASGAYGDVWRGRYLKDDVAIKRIKHDSTRHIQKFMDEILLMSKMQCNYIVEFVGASWRRPTDLACVVEYMDLGDLRSFLSKTTPDQFTWPQKHMSISSIVHGLLYLHTFETPIIHRDLKSRNVLLDSKKGTKLTDFGESREVDENTLTCGIGTYQWMAPEVISGREYTVAADVYSLGVLLTEFSTHLTPYTDMINPHTQKQFNQQYLLTQVTSGKIRPTIDVSTTPTWVADLALQCMATNPEDRPSIMVIAAMVPRIV
ncbi:TKL protein kinase [Saprolegnia diclina VS20]|uniref:TKL protein kinase n=1 Tax=Saprolegnia diclina (strain VS20) TaxID=1156394 RepID=T0PUX1_SAPDV|nr:TKL protein kinase [Saprolegnia diclina VS20]EQC26026.1 TKL protein kinase [Saprolegnia diclina VS20]|eukprot:XP_008620547.1 TKL protein kinase [Saprolegnia diclina VS20]